MEILYFLISIIILILIPIFGYILRLESRITRLETKINILITQHKDRYETRT